MKRVPVIVLLLACAATAVAAAGCGANNSEQRAKLVTPAQVVQRFEQGTGKTLRRAAVPDEAWEQLGLGLDASRSEIERYGVFSVYVAKSGHLRALDSLLRDKATKKALPRGAHGIYWELDSNSDTWIAYKRYAGNVVLAWFSGSPAREADERWQRLDRVLAGLRG